MPPSTRTIEDSVSALQAQQRARAAAGITASLSCEPTAAVGRVAVRIRAQFFATAEVLATLAPVLRCEEIPRLDGKQMRRTRQSGEYVLDVPSGIFERDATYHLSVEIDPRSSASAAVTLHTFSKRVVAAVRSQMREATLSPAAGGKRRSRKARK